MAYLFHCEILSCVCFFVQTNHISFLKKQRMALTLVDNLEKVTPTDIRKIYWGYGQARKFLVALCKSDKRIERPTSAAVKKRVDGV